MVHSTGEMSTESAEQLLGKKKDKEFQWAKYSDRSTIDETLK